MSSASWGRNPLLSGKHLLDRLACKGDNVEMNFERSSQVAKWHREEFDATPVEMGVLDDCKQGLGQQAHHT